MPLTSILKGFSPIRMPKCLNVGLYCFGEAPFHLHYRQSLALLTLPYQTEVPPMVTGQPNFRISKIHHVSGICSTFNGLKYYRCSFRLQTSAILETLSFYVLLKPLWFPKDFPDALHYIYKLAVIILNRSTHEGEIFLLLGVYVDVLCLKHGS